MFEFSVDSKSHFDHCNFAAVHSLRLHRHDGTLAPAASVVAIDFLGVLSVNLINEFLLSPSVVLFRFGSELGDVLRPNIDVSVVLGREFREREIDCLVIIDLGDSGLNPASYSAYVISFNANIEAITLLDLLAPLLMLINFPELLVRYLEALLRVQCTCRNEAPCHGFNEVRIIALVLHFVCKEVDEGLHHAGNHF